MHLIWDWNGTLFGDTRALIDAVIGAFARQGLGVLDPSDHRAKFRRPIRSFFSDLAGRRLDGAQFRELLACFENEYRRTSKDVALAADALLVLRRWSEVGGTHSLLSMAPHEQLCRAVSEHGLDTYFEIIQGQVVSGSARERPDVKSHSLRIHLQTLGERSIHRPVLLGDTCDDAAAATEAGITCVLYLSPLGSLEEEARLRACGAPVATSLVEAVSLARGLASSPVRAAGCPPTPH